VHDVLNKVAGSPIGEQLRMQLQLDRQRSVERLMEER